MANIRGKKLTIPSATENREELEISYIVGGDV